MRDVKEKKFFDISGTEYYKNLPKFGFISGSSTHQDRISAIKKVYADSKVIIDTHTADGVKVGLEYFDKEVPLVCLATAKATKFEDVIKEALGFIPPRPKEFEGLEQKPQRFVEMDKDVNQLKKYIAENAIGN